MTTKLRGVEEFKIKERVMVARTKAGNGREFEYPGTIVGFSPKNYLVLIDGIRDPRWVEKRLNKIRRIGLVKNM